MGLRCKMYNMRIMHNHISIFLHICKQCKRRERQHFCNPCLINFLLVFYHRQLQSSILEIPLVWKLAICSLFAWKLAICSTFNWVHASEKDKSHSFFAQKRNVFFCKNLGWHSLQN